MILWEQSCTVIQQHNPIPPFRMQLTKWLLKHEANIGPAIISQPKDQKEMIGDSQYMCLELMKGEVDVDDEEDEDGVMMKMMMEEETDFREVG